MSGVRALVYSARSDKHPTSCSFQGVGVCERHLDITRMVLIEVDDDATLAFASMLCYLTARVKARQALIPPNPIPSISDTD